MFINTSRILFRNLNQSFHLSQYYCTHVKDLKWDIWTAVCVERLPVVTPTLTDLQRKYMETIAQIEDENSMKSDHEIRHENDLSNADILKTNAPAEELEDVAKESAQDFEDASNEEYNNFKVASLITEADKTNDVKSLERNLQHHLVLLVEQKLGNNMLYALPQGKHSEGETLRQCAERVLHETCGDSVDIQIYGNAPYGFYKYKYPKEESGAYGAKVFFYYGRHRNGQVMEDKKYKWLNRKELEKSLPEKYFNSINKFLVEERH